MALNLVFYFLRLRPTSSQNDDRHRLSPDMIGPAERRVLNAIIQQRETLGFRMQEHRDLMNLLNKDLQENDLALRLLRDRFQENKKEVGSLMKGLYSTAALAVSSVGVLALIRLFSKK